MCRWICLLLLDVAIIGSAVPAYPIESGTLKKSIDAPGVSTTITSKKLTMRNQDSQAVFEGGVVLTRGPLIVHSDRMVVQFSSKTHAGVQPASGGNGSERGMPPAKQHDAVSAISNRSVNRVEAMGSPNQVTIKYENGHAVCQKAVYFSEEEKIVLTGGPVAWEKGTRVSGQRITIFLAEERSVVEGDSHVHIEGEGKQAP